MTIMEKEVNTYKPLTMSHIGSCTFKTILKPKSKIHELLICIISSDFLELDSRLYLSCETV